MSIAASIEAPSSPGPAATYSRTAIALHWLMALMIVGSLSVGWYMADLPFSPTRLRLFNWHKWAGITILMLAALRLLWRLTHRPPAVPAWIPGWQRNAAHAVHWLLYALFFAVPLAGWAFSSAAGFQVVYLGLVPLPDWVPKDKALAEQLETLHAWLAYSLAAIVVVHIAAAVKHGFEDPAHYLSRMLAFGKP